MMKEVKFQPDYTNLLKVMYNQKPDYLPLYEHHIDAPFISRYTNEKVEIVSNNLPDLDEYFRKTIRFWMEHGYDAFDYEAGICDIIPGHGAILGGMQG
ncbi:hypothetical protein NXY31_24870 [Bacteroides salyersiae]|nr:hypothetical protein [Bacteroides salyersiae]